jgi:hypothetical protein
MEYALSTLSDIFPNTLADNVAFMFTNVPSSLAWNFCADTIPNALEDAPKFEIDNPFALQKKYLKLRSDPKTRTKAARLLAEVKLGEQNALGMLVNLFDWLDGLQPLRITEEQTPRGLAKVTWLLRKAKAKVQEGVWRARGTFMGE